MSIEYVTADSCLDGESLGAINLTPGTRYPVLERFSRTVKIRNDAGVEQIYDTGWFDQENQREERKAERYV